MRRLLITLTVLAVLVVGVNHGTAAYAEYQVSRELRAELGLSSDPEVRVNGFPFLTQAVAGRYDSVEVRATGVPLSGFGTVAVEATLDGVDAPASEVLAGPAPNLVADTVQARVRISATDLGHYLDVPDLQVSEPPRSDSLPVGAPPSGVVLTGTVGIGAIEQLVSVQAQLSLQAGELVVTATDVTAGGTPPTDAPADAPAYRSTDRFLQSALDQLSARLDPSQLPFGLTPTSVWAEGSDIVVEGRGTGVVVLTGIAP